jgi:hypothetical protein
VPQTDKIKMLLKTRNKSDLFRNTAKKTFFERILFQRETVSSGNVLPKEEIYNIYNIHLYNVHFTKCT